MADSACIQQIECINGTDSNTDNEERRNHRYYVRKCKLFVHEFNGLISSDPDAGPTSYSQQLAQPVVSLRASGLGIADK